MMELIENSLAASLAPVPVVTPTSSPVATTAGGKLRVRRIAARVGRDGIVSTPPEWLALADDWNRLAGTIPFRRAEWLETWWRHYGQPGWELWILAVEDEGGRLVGIAPWYLAGDGLRGRTIHMLGSGEVCSEYQTLLCLPGREAQLAAALAEWLDSPEAGRWDGLLLAAVAQVDPAVGALTKELVRRGYGIHQRSGMSCWRATLADTWDEFLSGLSNSRRARVRQLTRKYFDSGRIVTRCITSRETLEQGFRILVELHQKRRASLGQPGCFSSPRFAAFHAEVCRRFQTQGMLRLLWTELDGRPISVEYALTGGQTVFYYQTGLEPAARSDDPGWVGMIASLRRAIGEGYRSFDFLRGEEAYKVSWGAGPQPMVETRIVGRQRFARWRHGTWLLRQQARDCARRGWQRAKQLFDRGRAGAPPSAAANPTNLSPRT